MFSTESLTAHTCMLKSPCLCCLYSMLWLLPYFSVAKAVHDVYKHLKSIFIVMYNWFKWLGFCFYKIKQMKNKQGSEKLFCLITDKRLPVPVIVVKPICFSNPH